MVVNGDGNTFTSTQTPKDPNSKSPGINFEHSNLDFIAKFETIFQL